MNAPPQHKSSAVIVLVIMGAVGLGFVLLCGCGIAGVWIANQAAVKRKAEPTDQEIQQQAELRWRREEQKAKTDVYRAKAFLGYWVEVLHMKNLDEPYRHTSKAFQERMSRAQFAEFLDAHPDFKDKSGGFSFQTDGFRGPPFRYELASPVRRYILTVVKDGNDWKLDQIDALARD